MQISVSDTDRQSIRGMRQRHMHAGHTDGLAPGLRGQARTHLQTRDLKPYLTYLHSTYPHPRSPHTPNVHQTPPEPSTEPTHTARRRYLRHYPLIGGVNHGSTVRPYYYGSSTMGLRLAELLFRFLTSCRVSALLFNGHLLQWRPSPRSALQWKQK